MPASAGGFCGSRGRRRRNRARLHEGEAVQHVAVPGAVRIAANNVHDPEHPGAPGTGGAVSEHLELVRHRDEDPVHARRRGQGRHDDVEVSRRNLHRDAHPLWPRSAKCGSGVPGLDVLDRVADDREQPCRSVELVERGPVCKRWVSACQHRFHAALMACFARQASSTAPISPSRSSPG
jgi:hypothetical protein